MKTIDTLKKYALAIVLAIAFIGTGVYAYRLKTKLDPFLNPKPSEAAKVVPAQVKQEIIGKYTDSLTRENHVKFTDKAKQLPQSALSDGTINKPLLDTISKALDIKSSQVNSYMKISVVSKAENLKATKTIDSLKRILYQYKNQFINLSFTTPDSTEPRGKFGYKYSNQIKATQYTPKKFLGIPIGKDVIDISSPDPNADFNGLSAFSIKPSERFFGAEIQAVTSYNINTGAVSPGFGGQVRLGRFYLQGAGYYNLKTKTVLPLLTGRLALFRY